MSFIKNIFKNNVELEQVRGKEIEEPPKEPFVADITTYELQDADWNKFGSMLKQNRVLPNSYIKRPVDVKVSASKNGSPMVLVTFNSATSTSVRKFLLLQDRAFQYVNDAIDDGKDVKLNTIWQQFQDDIRYISMLEANREGGFHKARGERMMKTAERIINYEHFYELEQAFLEKYKDATFMDFGHYFSDKPSYFVKAEYLDGGRRVRGESVVPFSPKTLEFCILKMSDDLKIYEGYCISDFVRKCKKLQEYSAFESDAWDKVIEFGKELVTEKHNESIEDDEWD